MSLDVFSDMHVTKYKTQCMQLDFSQYCFCEQIYQVLICGYKSFRIIQK